MPSNAPDLAPGLASAARTKVAIPRLQRPHPPQGSGKDRRRVARACTACRNHKIKCSGSSPQCKHCESTGRECIYIMPRKDRLKIVAERCAQMAAYLKALKHAASDEDAVRISELLDIVEEDISDMPQAQTPSNPDVDADESREFRAMMANGTADFQSHLEVDSLDLDENLHENERSRATGFVGKNAEVQWLRTLLLQERQKEDPGIASSSISLWTNSEQVSLVTFYLDTENVDLDYEVDAYELPPPETAERLLVLYMEKVHDSFPILPKKLFEDQFLRYFQGMARGAAPRLNPKWQAILNLVFAIGARYSHLSKEEWRADERDHLIYQARARRFAWNDATLSQHPDLPQIQVAGLLAFYYLSAGQVSRAWVAVGMALRFAQALGLHVRNEDPSASGPKREVLVRIWWSLYSLDRQLSVITGRPSVIVDSNCSVTLPLPLSEEQVNDTIHAAARISRLSSSSAVSALTSPTYTGPYPMTGIEPPHTPTGFARPDANSGSFFRAIVQMATITQTILSSLYSASTMIRSPGELQQDISQLNQRLDNWAGSLPAEFDFHMRRSGMGTPLRNFYRERVLLGFQFYGARILLTRPCLGGFGPGRDGRSPTASVSFLHNMAVLCVEAAKAELDLLPDHPDARFISKNGPWWSNVHHLTQAVAAILLALSSSSYAFEDPVVLASYAKKAIRWLRSMYDRLAERAYLVALNAFRVVASKLALDITDLWNEHAMAYPSMGQTVVGDDVSEMAFPTKFANSSPVLRYGPDISMPAPRPPVPAFVSFESPPASIPIPLQTMGDIYDNAYH
ncbi:hypothetical protein K458DRAFT_394724 [Lentithecium fluviatile CBS 122367]|uniref:Zn(2)-C6 fungal-type domain-containing protein n=1 Tax=Lentithecium fluviatile CBS 122367 TaxID=1168545 RepID=A0A6G1IKB3_9PLEO|nr:hypothetical protein K458DRAFT_394724 [Lentithecium fluviatile CBS 122367]